MLKRQKQNRSLIPSDDNPQMNQDYLSSKPSSKKDSLKLPETISPSTAVQRALAVFDALGLIRPTADLLFKKN